MKNNEPAENQSPVKPPRKPFFKRFWWLVILMVIVLVVTGVSLRGIIHNYQLEQPSSKPDQTSPENKPEYTNRDVFTEGHFYTDDSNARFTFSPVALDDITEIEPLGYSSSGEGMDVTGGGTHKIPSDHLYVRTGDKEQNKIFKVYAVADCYLVAIIYNKGVWQGSNGTLHQLDDYALHFQVSKNLFILETCLTDLTPELKARIGPLQEGGQNFPGIPVKAGELLGQSGGSPALRSIDLWAVDLSKPAQFIHPDWYGKLGGYSINPLDYFTEPVRSQLYAKLPDRPEPRAGQFAYDIDGKLVGDWYFLNNPQNYPDIRPDRVPQLGYFYCNRDPSLIFVGYELNNMVYVVKNNGPDPKDISISSGLVKYELMNERHRTADPSYFNTEAVMLVQMMENRKIRMELFDGVTADKVTGFDSNAIDFYR